MLIENHLTPTYLIELARRAGTVPLWARVNACGDDLLMPGEGRGREGEGEARAGRLVLTFGINSTRAWLAESELSGRGEKKKNGGHKWLVRVQVPVIVYGLRFYGSGRGSCARRAPGQGRRRRRREI